LPLDPFGFFDNFWRKAMKKITFSSRFDICDLFPTAEEVFEVLAKKSSRLKVQVQDVYNIDYVVEGEWEERFPMEPETRKVVKIWDPEDRSQNSFEMEYDLLFNEVEVDIGSVDMGDEVVPVPGGKVLSPFRYKGGVAKWPFPMALLKEVYVGKGEWPSGAFRVVDVPSMLEIWEELEEEEFLS
jgi:hypothetical protein